MSDSDSFIDEVTEEVRRDKLFAAFRKYGWIAILVIVVLVGGAAWKEWQIAKHRSAAQAFGDAVLGAQSDAKPGAAAKGLDGIAAEGGQKAVVEMLAASEYQKAGDTKAAMAALDKVAQDQSVPQAYRDLAQLKKVSIAGDLMSKDQRTQVLGALAQPGRPFRLLAMEQQALMQVAEGKTKTAIATYTQIRDDAGATAGLRQRAHQMIVALGGTTPKAG
ncbi:tetratricopeptide repeat protein [Acidimangrovimonas sediminis]|uniref:tetratricopeptide repeat protein n=1 Tax=Acidimangrovimonas sediminis TaxID=2056283 RepID=UPI000C7FB461|nr:tetratricopeptide repeat protein [Acidimangrovimonas sediminis]